MRYTNLYIWVALPQLTPGEYLGWIGSIVGALVGISVISRAVALHTVRKEVDRILRLEEANIAIKKITEGHEGRFKDLTLIPVAVGKLEVAVKSITEVQGRLEQTIDKIDTRVYNLGRRSTDPQVELK